MGISQKTSIILLKPWVVSFYSWLALCLPGTLFRAKVTCFPSHLFVLKSNLSTLPAPAQPSTITDIPLLLGTYSQRSWVSDRTGEFLSLNFAFLVSIVALGFAALSHGHIFLALKISYRYFKAQGTMSVSSWSSFCLNSSIHHPWLVPGHLTVDHLALLVNSHIRCVLLSRESGTLYSRWKSTGLGDQQIWVWILVLLLSG